MYHFQDIKLLINNISYACPVLIDNYSVKVCGVTLGVKDKRRLTSLSGLLNDKVGDECLNSSLTFVTSVFSTMTWKQVIAAYLRLHDKAESSTTIDKHLWVSDKSESLTVP